jgi:hypothetical protein
MLRNMTSVDEVLLDKYQRIGSMHIAFADWNKASLKAPRRTIWRLNRVSLEGSIRGLTRQNSLPESQQKP